MCQNIVFGGDLQVNDDVVSDGGSDIDWQMQRLQLSDEDDNEDLNNEDFFASDLYKYNNFDDNYSNTPEANHFNPIMDLSLPPQSSTMPSTSGQVIPSQQQTVIQAVTQVLQSPVLEEQSLLWPTRLPCALAAQSLLIPTTPQHTLMKWSKTLRTAVSRPSATLSPNLLFPLLPTEEGQG